VEGKKVSGSLNDKVEATLDALLVQFGKEILKIIPGKVSTEVDAKLSFDTKASVEKALHIIEVFPTFTLKRLALAYIAWTFLLTEVSQ
jgi:transaldolase